VRRERGPSRRAWPHHRRPLARYSQVVQRLAVQIDAERPYATGRSQRTPTTPAHIGRKFVESLLAIHRKSCWQRPGDRRIRRMPPKKPPRRKQPPRAPTASHATVAGAIDPVCDRAPSGVIGALSIHRGSDLPGPGQGRTGECATAMSVVEVDFGKRHEAHRALLRREKVRRARLRSKQRESMRPLGADRARHRAAQARPRTANVIGRDRGQTDMALPRCWRTNFGRWMSSAQPHCQVANRVALYREQGLW
jgi:hypothetical protein